MGAIMIGDLHIFDVESKDQVQASIADFKKWCLSVLVNVFHRRIDVRKDFELWFDEYLRTTQDPVLVLHDDPLYVVCRFLSLDPHQLSDATLAATERLAIREKWFD